MIANLSPQQIEDLKSASPAFRHHIQFVATKDLYGVRQNAWCEAFAKTHLRLETTQKICLEWSQVAEDILISKCNGLFQNEDIALFALGKLGAKELNLSSDVDLLFVTGENRDDLVPKVRQFQQEISFATDRGFLFRVDFELRPGGRSSPILPTLDQLIDYYGNYGETWERMAFIRLRGLWGNQKLISEVERFREKFSFRKHLDYGLLDDLNALRNKVQSAARLRRRQDFIDLKLGIGGIRDIELFCHALQVIHGGRNQQLQTHGTSAAFDQLGVLNILPQHESLALKDLYWELRHWENWSQGLEDQQIYFLDKNKISENAHQSLVSKMASGGHIVSSLLGKVSEMQDRLPELIEDQKIWLLAHGFSTEEIQKDWENPHAVPILSRQKERDANLRAQVLAQLLAKMGEKSSTQHRLMVFRDFFYSMRAKSSFYFLLLKNPVLIELIAEALCCSPYLSRILCSRPEILDGLIVRNLDLLKSDTDWDDFLVGLGELKKMTEFLSGIDYLRTKRPEPLFETLSYIADDIVKRLLEKIRNENPNVSITVLALGKWGGRELGLFSDLDCIFLCDHEPQQDDFRGLRRFLNRLTESNRGGSLYQIDTRLRPSENSGVLLTSITQFKEYIRSSAHPWERQAYLKARMIEGSDELSVWIRSELSSKSLDEDSLRELERVRQSLLGNKRGVFDIKYSEGGLLDCELAVQSYVLHQQLIPLESSLKAQVLAIKTHRPDLESACNLLWNQYSYLRTIEQNLRLISEESQPTLDPEKDSFIQLAHLIGKTSDELQNDLRSALDQSLMCLKSLDPRQSQKYQ